MYIVGVKMYAEFIERINIIKVVSNVFWTCGLICYYFQFPFVELSGFIVPAMGGYIFFNIGILKKILTNKRFIYAWYLLVLFVFMNILNSNITNTFSGNTWRFALIVIIIPICMQLKTKRFEIEYSIFKWLSVIKAIYLIVIAIWMINVGNYEPFRIWASSLGGDMYFVYDFFPRIQLAGNALLLVALMIEIWKKKKMTITVCILLLGVIFEGNFSFYLGLILFICFIVFHDVSKRISAKKLGVIFGVLVLLLSFYQYAESEREKKAAGGNALRTKQAEILMDTNYLLGSGLGAAVPDNTKLGRKADATYYEYQTLYIFYQIGFIGMLIFYIALLQGLMMIKNRELKYLYVSYLIASFFNPYCFDTTQIIVSILCANYAAIEDKGTLNDEC